MSEPAPGDDQSTHKGCLYAYWLVNGPWQFLAALL